MARKSGATDLVEQLAFYGAYHTAPLNVAIHVIFVPLIFATALVLLHALPHPSLLDVAVPLPALLGLGPETLVQLTPSFLISACYAGYFVLLEPFAGVGRVTCRRSALTAAGPVCAPIARDRSSQQRLLVSSRDAGRRRGARRLVDQSIHRPRRCTCDPSPHR